LRASITPPARKPRVSRCGPTELLIFGSAKAGTPLMQSRQTIGIDLPLKALAWEDSTGAVWLSCNDPAWLAARHGLADGGGVVTTMAATAGRIVEAGRRELTFASVRLSLAVRHETFSE